MTGAHVGGGQEKQMWRGWKIRKIRMFGIRRSCPSNDSWKQVYYEAQHLVYYFQVRNGMKSRRGQSVRECCSKRTQAILRAFQAKHTASLRLITIALYSGKSWSLRIQITPEDLAAGHYWCCQAYSWFWEGAMFSLQTPGLLGRASAEPALNIEFIGTLKTSYLWMDFLTFLFILGSWKHSFAHLWIFVFKTNN